MAALHKKINLPQLPHMVLLFEATEGIKLTVPRHGSSYDSTSCQSAYLLAKYNILIFNKDHYVFIYSVGNLVLV